MRTYIGKFCAIAILGCIVTTTGCSSPDEPIMSKAGDPVIAAATTEARRALPIFWSKFNAKTPGYSEFALKVGFQARGGGIEYLWVVPSTRQADVISGTLANDAEYVEGFKVGTKVAFGEAQIDDWQYGKDGKLYGHFTTRALMTRASEAERKEAMAVFAPTPLEAGAN